MTGAAIKRIVLRDIKQAKIPIPELPEQQRIVGILDEAFDGIASQSQRRKEPPKRPRSV